jgi:hypothetical protein
MAIQMSRDNAEFLFLPSTLDVLCERHRQITEEGWTPEHDDEHPPGDLAQAGAAYAVNAVNHLTANHLGFNIENSLPPIHWPWNFAWWKPKTTRDDMVRAAALIIAEIEKMDRAEVGDDQG